MAKCLQISICVLVLIWLGACASLGTANDPAELAHTLNAAYLAIPAQYYRLDVQSRMTTPGRIERVGQELANLAGDKKIPLVIYLHGCDGLNFQSYADIDLLLRNGYAVLAPDSFARKYKPQSCDPRTYTGGLHRGVLDFRLAEAGYAHEATKNLPWVDKRNIFMMGFSEGGITTAKYPNSGLAGRIILGWTCRSGWFEYVGISGPRDEPILAIVASNDPWFRNSWTYGNCGSSMLFRENAESIVIEADFHAIQNLSEVQERIINFLNAKRRP